MEGVELLCIVELGLLKKDTRGRGLESASDEVAIAIQAVEVAGDDIEGRHGAEEVSRDHLSTDLGCPRVL